jgi:hypothetical protein
MIDFYPKSRKAKYNNSKAGVSSDCKECVKNARSVYVLDNKEVRANSDRKYHLSKYGLTPKDYNRMFADQEGRCKGCKRHQSELNGRNLSVDHCHVTGKVRGLLCHNCNAVLGMALDKVSTLERLIGYLNHNAVPADNQSGVASEELAKKVGYLYS